MAEGATRVTVANTGQTFTCPEGELILDAGLEAGIGLPHNCRGGACGTCKSQILEGEVDHGWVMSFAISDEEKAAGKCLICQSRPLTPTLVIRTDNAVAGAEETPPAPIEARGQVIAAEPVTPSIRRLVIALPPGVRFRYRAGMHVELRTPGVAERRTYSIACAPDEQDLPADGLLEFLVTRHDARPGERLAAQCGAWQRDRPARPLRQLPSAQERRRPGPMPGRRLWPLAHPRDRAPRAGDRLEPPDDADPLGARPQRGIRARRPTRARPSPRQLHLPRHPDLGKRATVRLAPRPHPRLARRGTLGPIGMARARRRPTRLRRRLRRQGSAAGGRVRTHPDRQLHADRTVVPPAKV